MLSPCLTITEMTRVSSFHDRPLKKIHDLNPKLSGYLNYEVMDIIIAKRDHQDLPEGSC